MSRWRLILGGPGTGKTRRLIDILIDEIKRGVTPERIAFVSFTNKAIDEALHRVKSELELRTMRFPFIRTLHSLGYRQLGLNRSSLMSRSDVRTLGKLLNVKINGGFVSVDDDETAREGDRMMFLDHVARNTGEVLRSVWENHGRNWEIGWHQVERFSRTMRAYKESRSIMDYTDILERFVERDQEIPVSVAVIDEAQDLTDLQWRMVYVAFRSADRVYVAGDDDQAIYEWSGAATKRFLSLKVDEIDELRQSFRLPRTIFDFAWGIRERISHRYEKHFSSTIEIGNVDRAPSIETVDLNEDGTWFILARNVCHLDAIEDECMRQGIPFTTRGGRSSVNPEELEMITVYERMRRGERFPGSVVEKLLPLLGVDRSIQKIEQYGLDDLLRPEQRGIWHDVMTGIPADVRTYYLTMRRRGIRITDRPRVHVDTIHGVKGGEADNVVLTTDITRGVEEGMDQSADGENRVFYVGATRARRRLIIIEPQTDRSFPL